MSNDEMGGITKIGDRISNVQFYLTEISLIG